MRCANRTEKVVSGRLPSAPTPSHLRPNPGPQGRYTTGRSTDRGAPSGIRTRPLGGERAKFDRHRYPRQNDWNGRTVRPRKARAPSRLWPFPRTSDFVARERARTRRPGPSSSRQNKPPLRRDEARGAISGGMPGRTWRARDRSFVPSPPPRLRIHEGGTRKNRFSISPPPLPLPLSRALSVRPAFSAKCKKKIGSVRSLTSFHTTARTCRPPADPEVRLWHRAEILVASAAASARAEILAASAASRTSAATPASAPDSTVASPSTSTEGRAAGSCGGDGYALRRQGATVKPAGSCSGDGCARRRPEATVGAMVVVALLSGATACNGFPACNG